MNKDFVRDSNLPINTVKYCFVAGNEDIYLGDNIYTVKTLPCKDVYKEISYHPDIQMAYVGDGNVIVCPNMYDKYVDLFEDIGLSCIRGITSLKDTYPYDIAYNACIIDRFFIHNLKYTDPVLLNYVKTVGFECINVNQGYTKCNISVVDKDSIITSDKGIERELKQYFDVLYINPDENILLGNMIGFIGGATGLIGKNKWAINGDIYRLNEADKIIDFLKRRNIEIVCLNKGEIRDIGSIIPIKYA